MSQMLDPLPLYHFAGKQLVAKSASSLASVLSVPFSLNIGAAQWVPVYSLYYNLLKVSVFVSGVQTAVADEVGALPSGLRAAWSGGASSWRPALPLQTAAAVSPKCSGSFVHKGV